MPKQLITSETAAALGKSGGNAKRDNRVLQKAQAWVRENGVEKAIDWVEGKDSSKARFAFGLLFTYALGKPKDTIEVNTTFEAIMAIKEDPHLDEIIDGFAKWNVARNTRQLQNPK